MTESAKLNGLALFGVSDLIGLERCIMVGETLYTVGMVLCILGFIIRIQVFLAAENTAIMKKDQPALRSRMALAMMFLGISVVFLGRWI
jgi:hypothetical protein